jgi:hypothetical protein
MFKSTTTPNHLTYLYVRPGDREAVIAAFEANRAAARSAMLVEVAVALVVLAAVMVVLTMMYRQRKKMTIFELILIKQSPKQLARLLAKLVRLTPEQLGELVSSILFPLKYFRTFFCEFMCLHPVHKSILAALAAADVDPPPTVDALAIAHSDATDALGPKPSTVVDAGVADPPPTTDDTLPMSTSPPDVDDGDTRLGLPPMEMHPMHPNRIIHAHSQGAIAIKRAIPVPPKPATNKPTPRTGPPASSSKTKIPPRPAA